MKIPDSESQQLIHDTANEVLDDWINETPPRQFTLYDVTRQVRKLLGHGFFIPHSGDNGAHDMILDLVNDKIGNATSGWNRVLIEPDGLKLGEPKPQLYYHLSTDPMSYSAIRSVVTMTQPDGQPAPDPQTVVGLTLVSAPCDLRLCIPKSLMDSEGLLPGEQVAVIPLGDCLLIKKATGDLPAGSRRYVVDLRGTIRVPKTVLDSVGLIGLKFTAVVEYGCGLLIKA